MIMYPQKGAKDKTRVTDANLRQIVSEINKNINIVDSIGNISISNNKLGTITSREKSTNQIITMDVFLIETKY